MQANVAECLQLIDNQGLSISDVVIGLLKSHNPLHRAAHTALVASAPTIIDAFVRVDDSLPVPPPQQPLIPLSPLFSCITQHACTLFRQEITRLANKDSGFHSGASTYSLEQLESWSVQQIYSTFIESAPSVTRLVRSLLDSIDGRRRFTLDPLTGNVVNRATEVETGHNGDVNDTEEPMAIDRDIIVEEEMAELHNEGPAEHEEYLSGDANIAFDEEAHQWADQMEENYRKENSLPGTAEDIQRRYRKWGAQRRAALRNEALLNIRTSSVMSIFMQSSNEKCNAMQTVIGVFLHSVNAPERCINLISHLGLSVSSRSIHNTVSSLSKKAQQRIREEWKKGLMQIAFDNLDFNFKTREPTTKNSGSFISTTSATFIPLSHGVTDADLACSDKLWDQNPINPKADPTKIYVPSLKDLLPSPTPVGKVSDQVLRNAWHIRSILVSSLRSLERFRDELGTGPQPSDNVIDPIQTKQYPARLMRIAQSTADGNAEVLANLLGQAGIPDDKIQGHVLLCHGDLGTVEKLQSIMISRSIEDQEINRIQYAQAPVLGLFHLDMAALDALWRTHIQPPASHGDPGSLFGDIGILRPKETLKFKSGPSYRQMHDFVYVDVTARVLNCWMIKIQEEYPQHTDLESFAAGSPSWGDIERLSLAIAQSFIAGDDFEKKRRCPNEERDLVFENSQLWLRDALLYIELGHASKHGDVGRIEETILPWAWFFEATGKHKYATQVTRFLLNLRHCYPNALRNAIEKHWLCNPTGKLDGFRPVDWLVELNNLYTKVIFGGSFSSHEIDYIIKQSILIDVFRTCHKIVENNFYINSQTTRHGKPDMTRMIEKLVRHFEFQKVHLNIKGRGFGVTNKVLYSVPNQQSQGCNDLLNKSGAIFACPWGHSVNTEDGGAGNDESTDSSQTVNEVYELNIDDFIW